MKSSLWVYDGGWVYVPTPGSDLEIRMRFAERPEGRLEAIDVWISRKEGISATALRNVPLAQIEALANSPVMAKALLEKMHGPSATSEPELEGVKNRLASLAPAEPMPLPPAKLEVPASRKKPDTFYQEVATAYMTLASMDRRPATVLAEQNNVPITTVHRWVKEARARGFLAPGRRLSRNRPSDQGGDEA
jgi:hypothetical protein